MWHRAQIIFSFILQSEMFFLTNSHSPTWSPSLEPRTQGHSSLMKLPPREFSLNFYLQRYDSYTLHSCVFSQKTVSVHHFTDLYTFINTYLSICIHQTMAPKHSSICLSPLWFSETSYTKDKSNLLSNNSVVHFVLLCVWNFPHSIIYSFLLVCTWLLMLRPLLG